jgi:anaerobic selenocysteine-containing dehydrogenase
MINKTLGSQKFWINAMGGPTMAGAEFINLIEGLTTGKPYRPKAGLVFGTNPMSTARNPELIAEALKNFELLVVTEVAATPTTRYADIVLPSATRYESLGDLCIWENHMSISNQVIKPLWETRSDLEIVLDLAGRLGMGKDFWEGDYNAMLEEFLQSTLKPTGKTLTVKQLRKNALKGIYLPRTKLMDQRERYEKHFAHLPGQKVQLYNEILLKAGFEPMPVYRGEPEDPINAPELFKKYPLIFTDEHSEYINHHSWMRSVPWLREIRKNNYIKINPKTAEKYGIKEGDWVEVTSPNGVMKAVAWIFPGIRPDTLMGQHGNWQGCDALGLPEYSTLKGGTNPNILFNWGNRDRITENITKNTLVSIRKSSVPSKVLPIKEVG